MILTSSSQKLDFGWNATSQPRFKIVYSRSRSCRAKPSRTWLRECSLLILVVENSKRFERHMRTSVPEGTSWFSVAIGRVLPMDSKLFARLIVELPRSLLHRNLLKYRLPQWLILTLAHFSVEHISVVSLQDLHVLRHFVHHPFLQVELRSRQRRRKFREHRRDDEKG